MNFEIKKATRQGVKPLVGMYGKSGSGKTMSALLLARGIVGPKGRIVLVDSEAGRGSLFADIIPGGYDTIAIEPPFSPDRYYEALDVAEAGADAVVIDSLTHEHNGEGGVLDMQEAELDRMAGDDWKKREACKMAAWIKPKIAHKQFVQRLLRSKVALICCLRGEEKTHIKKESGQTKVVTDEFSSPLFDPRFIFELLLNFETIARNGKGGYVIPRKITHPAIADLLPGDDEQLSIRHGEALAKWCAAPGASQSAGVSEVDTLKRELWRLTKHVHGENRQKLLQFLIDEAYLTPAETLDGLTADRLREVVSKLKANAPALALV
jgi:hypothetical protein